MNSNRMMMVLQRFASARSAIALLVVLAASSPHTASAQALAAIVNGDPITTTEVEEMMKLRRFSKQPATRDLALEDLVADRIKLRAANRGGLDATDAGFAQALAQIAAKAGTTANALVAGLQANKVNIDIVRSHVRAVAAWNELVRSRYKALSVSEQEVDAELARNGAKGDADYTLQQVVFVLPVGAAPAVIEQRTREAQALRGRFQDCASGVPLARALPNVVVKPAITKNAAALSEASRTALSQTQKGRLTTPSRTPSGIEMVAVCNINEEGDRTSLRDNVQANLLVARLGKEAEKMYKDLRATAVVEKR